MTPQQDGFGQDAPARTVLSTRSVRVAALAFIDDEGPDALSMRRLAAKLDRKAMSLYRYALSKSALLDGVVELVLEDLSIDPEAADWKQALRDLAADFQRMALAHPHVVPMLVTLPRATPLGLRPIGTLRLLEGFLGLLTRAGFTPDYALNAYRLFFDLLHGHALGELQETVLDPHGSEDLQLVLHRLPRGQFPLLQKLSSALSAFDGAHQLRQGVEMMISGLESRLRLAAPPVT